MDKQVKTSFSVGERIIYQPHGAGTIEGLIEEEVAGMTVELYQIKLDSGDVIKVANATARKEFQSEVVDFDIEKITSILGEKPQKRYGSWSHSERVLTNKLRKGELTALAEMVRDLHPRGKEVAYNVRRLYQTALYQLTSRLSSLLGHADFPETLRYLETKCDLEFRDDDVRGSNYVAPTQPKPGKGRKKVQQSPSGQRPAPKTQTRQVAKPPSKVVVSQPNKSEKPVDPAETALKAKKKPAKSTRSLLPKKQPVSAVKTPTAEEPVADKMAQEELLRMRKELQQAKQETAQVQKRLETVEQQRDRIAVENKRVREQRDRANTEWIKKEEQLKRQTRELQKLRRLHAEITESFSVPPELKELFGALVVLIFWQNRALHEQAFNSYEEGKWQARYDAYKAKLEEVSAELKTARRTATMRANKIKKLQKELKVLKSFVRQTKQHEARQMKLVMKQINAVRDECMAEIEAFARRRRLLK